jgi:hypothetical protein
MEIARRDPAVTPPKSIRRTSFHTQHHSVFSAARVSLLAGNSINMAARAEPARPLKRAIEGVEGREVG